LPRTNGSQTIAAEIISFHRDQSWRRVCDRRKLEQTLTLSQNHRALDSDKINKHANGVGWWAKEGDATGEAAFFIYG
jgi:hypothetical protein